MFDFDRKTSGCHAVGGKKRKRRCDRDFQNSERIQPGSEGKVVQHETGEVRPTRRNTTVTKRGEEVRKENVLRIEAARLEIRRNFYNVRAAKAWNTMPDHVKSQKSVNAFKNAYDRWKSNPNQDCAMAAANGSETMAEPG